MRAGWATCRAIDPTGPVLRQVLTATTFTKGAVNGVMFLSRFILFRVRLVRHFRPTTHSFVARGIVTVRFGSLGYRPLWQYPTVKFVPLFANFMLTYRGPTEYRWPTTCNIYRAVNLFVIHRTSVRQRGNNDKGRHRLFTSPIMVTMSTIFVVPRMAICHVTANANLLTRRHFYLFLTFRHQSINSNTLRFGRRNVRVSKSRLNNAGTHRAADVARPAKEMVPA